MPSSIDSRAMLKEYPRIELPAWADGLIKFRTDDWEEEDFPLGDGVADTETEVVCPYCGEVIELGLDPGSGAHQEYVEDCEVCCRPWSVRVSFDESGSANVELRALDE